MSSHLSILLFKHVYKELKPFQFYSWIFSRHLCTSYSYSLQHNSLQKVQLPKHVEPYFNEPIEKVLSIAKFKIISAFETVSILKTLRMHVLFKTDNLENLKNNKDFQKLCKIFQNNCPTLKPNLLISGLRSLLEIGVPTNSSYVVSAEESILENVDVFSTFDLISCLYFHHKFLETDLQRKVVSVLTNKLHSKIFEISSTSEVLMIVHFFHLFDDVSRKDVQNKIIELMPALNTREMCKVLSTLSSNSIRNIYILHSISFYLMKKDEYIDVKDTLDILHSLKKLNFFDKMLLGYLFKRLQGEILSISQQSVISGILTVCGQLKWRQEDILKACSEWIINNQESCRMKEYVSYVLTTAVLNYREPKSLEIIVSLLNEEKIGSTDVWLDVVWSLAVLNFIDKSMIENVLSSKLYKKLSDNSSTVIKLLNLKSVMKIHYPECIFKCDLFLEPPLIPQSSETESQRKHVINVLSNFIPNDKYLSTNQNSDLGIFIDAEFILDQKAKPVVLKQYGTITSKPSETKPLPEGFKRFAVLILFFKDYTLNEQSLVGNVVLAQNILKEFGYTVILIPFEEFRKNETEIKKAKYLLQKIRKN